MADMSFLPEDYLERRAQRRTNVLCFVLFVIVMGAGAGAYIVSDRQRQDVLKQRLAVNEQYADAARRLEQLDELQKQKQQMMRKAKVTGALVERLPRSLILSQIVNNMPATLSLFELELETKVIKSTAPAAKTALDKAKAEKKPKAAKPGEEPEPQIMPTQVSVLLTGVAKTDVDVAAFMASMKDSPIFANINLVYAESLKVNEVPMRKFRIEAVVDNEVDLRKFEPLMVKRDLKQNPMADHITIDDRGQVVNKPPGPDVIQPASDKPLPRKGLAKPLP